MMEAKAMISISAALVFAAMSALGSQGTPAVQAPEVPPSAIAVDRSVLERYVGIYKCELGTAKVAVAKDGRLTLQIDRLRPIPLIADGEAQFHPEGVKATLVFHSDADGISHFVLHREGKEIRADRKRSKA
jgi:hypothetical protein